MQPWLAITRVLSILAILGLVLAPFTVSAVAAGIDASTIRADILPAMMPKADAIVTAGLTCCTPTPLSMLDCPKGCPLAAVCHAKIVEGVATTSALVRWSRPAQVSMPGDDAAPDTLTQAPPDRPPQA